MKTLIFETTASNHHKPIDKMLWSIFSKEKPKKLF